MATPNFIIFYVSSIETSIQFYADLLGKQPLDASPTFAMFALESGMMLGLWAKHVVAPKTLHIGGVELAFTVADHDSVLTQHKTWIKRGLTILQPPTQMDFGFTFTAVDPDGHRLRIFAPSKI